MKGRRNLEFSKSTNFRRDDFSWSAPVYQASRAATNSPYDMSLFGSDSDEEEELDIGGVTASLVPTGHTITASRLIPPIPGLHHFTSLLPASILLPLSTYLSSHYFTSNNQSMVFGTLPAFLQPLLDALPILLAPRLSPQLYGLLFNSTRPRQAIFNLYLPGEGITPHIDLPHRYEDGILGISLLSTTVMDFSRDQMRHSIVLRQGDIYILEGEARDFWKHEIVAREGDWVREEDGDERWVKRRTRMSVTLRRMKVGADIVGEEVGRE